ncbi:hypothetical protein ACFL1Z_09240 [Thermodesulfobacteriota bacterium]
MAISATYLCPVQGLHSLEPPEPGKLSKAAKAAFDLGINRLSIPVLEEPLNGPRKIKINYLDGIIGALDRIGEGGATAWLIAPARRILGLDWVPPYLVKAIKDPTGIPVFLEGRIRNLCPYNWWRDIPVFQRRVAIFREMCTAVSGHPALKGWVVMDRDLDWYRPDLDAADLMLKSILAEIKERDENIPIYLGLSWAELLEPEIAQELAMQVDGIRISGLDQKIVGLRSNGDPNEELIKAAYVGAITGWMFGLPYEVEAGWDLMNWGKDPELVFETFRTLSPNGLLHLDWVNLIDPEPRLLDKPPWVIDPGLGKIGLLDYGMEPKEHVEAWLDKTGDTQTGDEGFDFIDLSYEEYSLDPQTHLPRLWDHFRDSYL